MKRVKLFEEFINEATQRSVSGTSGRTYLELDNRKYELKKPIKGVKIGNWTNQVLPKGTIIKNLPGGIFAYHTDLKDEYPSERWYSDGYRITGLEDTIREIEKNGKVLESLELDEATTSWSKMMKGVKDGGSGPWALVAIENGKVIAQNINIKIKDALPAHFEAMRREHPKAKIRIEDSEGMIVWNESKFNGNMSGDAAEYIAKELSHYVKGIIDQPNDNVTYFHLKDKSYKGKVIKTLKDVYGLDANDGGIMFSPSPTIVFDNDQILESTEVDEALNPKEFETAVKDLAYSMPKHTSYEDVPSDEQIMKAMQKYQKDLYTHSTTSQKKEAVEMVKQILSESKDSDTFKGNPSEDPRIVDIRAFRGSVKDLTGFIEDKIKENSADFETNS